MNALGSKYLTTRAFTQIFEFDLDFHCLARRPATEINDSYWQSLFADIVV